MACRARSVSVSPDVPAAATRRREHAIHCRFVSRSKAGPHGVKLHPFHGLQRELARQPHHLRLKTTS